MRSEKVHARGRRPKRPSQGTVAGAAIATLFWLAFWGWVVGRKLLWW